MKRANFFRAAAINAAVPLFLLGCSDQPSDHEYQSTRSGIIGGAPSSASRDAIVFLRGSQGGKWNDCTGTLLSPSVVLTARHCVAAMHPGEFVCDGAGELLQDGTSAGTFGATIDPAAVSIYTGSVPSSEPASKGRAIVSARSPHACRDDIALVVLDAPLTDTPPVAVRNGRVVLGETVTVVGYGLGDHADRVERREAGELRVVDVGDDQAGEHATTPARSFVVPGGNLCFGDSGGPALASGSGELLGVYSRISGDCYAPESRNTFTSAVDFGELIQSAFAAAGEDWPNGSAGAGGAAEISTGEGDPAPSGAEPKSAFRCVTSAAATHDRGAFAWVLAIAAASVLRVRSRRLAGAS